MIYFRAPDKSQKSGVIQQRQNCLEAQQAEGQEAPVLTLTPCISTKTENQVEHTHTLGIKRTDTPQPHSTKSHHTVCIIKIQNLNNPIVVLPHVINYSTHV